MPHGVKVEVNNIFEAPMNSIFNCHLIGVQLSKRYKKLFHGR